MIFIILAIVIDAIVVYNMVFKDSYGIDSDSIFFGVLFFVLLGILFLGGGIGLASLVGNLFPQDFIPTKTELVSLKDNIGVQGRYFLFSGYIDNELKYFYYFKNANGGYEKGDLENAVIFEDENDKPYLITYEAKFFNEGLMLIAFPAKTKTPEFHIPEGSIFRDYELNLSN